jgi:hypothetical protein
MVIEIIGKALGPIVIKPAVGLAQQRYASYQAKQELSKIGAAVVDAAIVQVPALSEDLQSNSFVEGILAPLLVEIVENPSTLGCPETLAKSYIRMFVDRFASRSTPD